MKHLPAESRAALALIDERTDAALLACAPEVAALLSRAIYYERETGRQLLPMSVREYTVAVGLIEETRAAVRELQTAVKDGPLLLSYN